MTTSGPTAVDLFAGVGGMSLGFQQAGFNVLAGFEFEARHVDTYNRNFTHCSYVQDLAYADAQSLRDIAGLPKVIDVVFGGPPCQGFSFGGRKAPDDPRNRLILDFARLVLELRPRIFVMENVQGLATSIGQGRLSEFLSTIKAGGYNVRLPLQILNAADYGVPQRRRRVFIIGARRGHRLPDYPEPLTSQSSRRAPPVTAFDAIGDLPQVDSFDSLLNQDVYTGPLGSPSAYALKLRTKPTKGQFRLTGCLRTEHSPAVVKRFANTQPGDQEPVSRYFRLHRDRPAPTIRAGTNVDFGRHTAPRPIHYQYPRCITAREAARLHGYPDWFEFHNTRWHAFRQIGNSVPPPLARAVALAVYAIL